jgi:hypothetical protein
MARMAKPRSSTFLSFYADSVNYGFATFMISFDEFGFTAVTLQSGSNVFGVRWDWVRGGRTGVEVALNGVL